MNIEGIPILSILIFFPLVAGVFLLFHTNANLIRKWALFFSGIEALLSIPLILNYRSDTAAFQMVEMIPWVPKWGLNYSLGIDGISYLMVLLSIWLLPFTILCSWSYIQTRVKEFHFCLFFLTSACVGVFCALALVLFYVYWEAMLIPMYLLIGVWGGPNRRYASLKFFLYTLAGSTLLLVAFVAFYVSADTFSIPELMKTSFSFKFQYWTFLAMGIAFAIKVPMFPFHTWLPAAHVEAPTAGSVVLASVLLKMGAYGFLRFCLPLTPDASFYFAPLMITLSIFSIIYGGLVALGQTDIKKLVAYSSVGHMGFVTLGIFIFNQEGIQGAILQMLNHGITTGAMFMMIGIIYERSHSRNIVDNLGLAKYLPVYIGFWGLFSLSSMGFPGTNSFVSEALVLIGAFKHSYLVGFLAIPGAMLAAAYMLHLLQRLSWGSPSPAKKWSDFNLREWSYIVPMAILVIYIGFAPGVTIRSISNSVSHLIERFHMPVAQIKSPMTMENPISLASAKKEVK